MSDFRAQRLQAVRAKIAALETAARPDVGVLPFGDLRIDGCLPGEGLPLGRWHEVCGAGLETELAAAPAAFAAVRKGDVIVSVAYGAVHAGWLCIEAVATDPAWRGQGLASRTVQALMTWGAAQGAGRAGLQVQAENAAAQSVYRRLGFDRELYRYHYMRQP